MLPILYEANETEFKNNGIGRLSDLISCTVSEKKNDTYTLDMTYPVKGKHFDDLKPGNIIFAIHDNSKTGQPFDIVSVSAPSHGTIRVKAQHISYRLKRLYCQPIYMLAGDLGPGAIIDYIDDDGETTSPNTFGENPFSITCELEDGDFPVYPNAPIVYEVDSYNPIYDILFDASMGILSDDNGWGECGEYVRDIFDIKLVKHRGRDKGIQMRTGKNVQLLTVSYDMENYYTGAIPYWDGKDPISGDSKHVDLRTFDAYDSGIVAANTDFPYDRLIPVDLSGMFDQPPTEPELRSEAQRYLQRASDKSSAYPQSYSIDLVHNPDNTSELQSADLCDFVQVQDVTLGVNVNLEVTEVTYDVVKEKYTSMVVGSKRKTIGRLLKDKFATPLQIDVSRLSSEVSDLAAKTTVDNKVYPTTYDPSDPSSWDSSTTETLYDADGKEVEQVATVNRAPVFTHKSGGSSGSGGALVPADGSCISYTPPDDYTNRIRMAMYPGANGTTSRICVLTDVQVFPFVIPSVSEGDEWCVSTFSRMTLEDSYMNNVFDNLLYGMAHLIIHVDSVSEKSATLTITVDRFVGFTRGYASGVSGSSQIGHVVFGEGASSGTLENSAFSFTTTVSMK